MLAEGSGRWAVSQKLKFISELTYNSNVLVALDCEQFLFFFRFSKGSARAQALSVEAARREKRGRQVPLPSRAFSHARGHLRVSGVLLDGRRKKRDCS